MTPSSGWIKEGKLTASPHRTDHVAADLLRHRCTATPVLDLDYAEDSERRAPTPISCMTGKGGIVEVQGTAEGEPFSEDQFGELMGLAKKGIQRLVSLQQMAVA